MQLAYLSPWPMWHVSRKCQPMLGNEMSWGRKALGDGLGDLLEMGSERKARPQQALCYRAGKETEELVLEELRKR